VALEEVRLRLAARAHATLADTGAAPVDTGTEPLGALQGRVDHVGRGRIAGWARDAASPDQRVRLRILDNYVTIGEAVADLRRADLERRRPGDGQCGFDFKIQGGLSPVVRHFIRVQRAADGRDLPNSPWMVPAVPLTLTAPVAPEALPGGGLLRGQLDLATRERIAGWAQDGADPETPMALQILDNMAPIARVLANRTRNDLAEAGIGNGRHGFDIIIPGGLSPLARHVIQVGARRTAPSLPVRRW